MLRHYLLVALRGLRRRPVQTAINVFGLAVGLACCLLILLYVRAELRYDRHHEHADRIARLVRETSALTAGPMGPALERDLPEVERAVRITGEAEVGLRTEAGVALAESIYFVDSTFTDVFTLDFMRGDPQTALDAPDALVVTASTARRLFGEEEAMGQAVTVQLDEPLLLTVTGVVVDPPATSHFEYDLLASFEPVAGASGRMENWHTNWLFTYLLLAPNVEAAALTERLPAFFERHTGEAWTHVRMQPLLDIRLGSSAFVYDIAPQGNRAYVWLFAGVALLILVIACINFVNLTTAQSLSRAREIGARKVFGAHRSQLATQFLGETALLVALAFGLAVWLASLLLPALQQIAGPALALADGDAGFVAAAALALMVAVGVLAGGYPAFVLARFRPVAALRGRSGLRSGRGRLRQGLVVFQFAVSIFLIAGTLVIDRQVSFLREARLGYAPEQVLVLDFGEALAGRVETVKRQLSRHPNVRAVAAADNVPGAGVSDFGYRPEGWTEEDFFGYDTYFVDEDYLRLLGMEMALGRPFGTAPGDTAGFVINETAHRRLVAAVGEAWADPIGKQLDFYLPGQTGWEVFRSGPVVGVVRDFHYRSLHAEIGPLVMQVLPFTFDYVLVKAATEDLDETLAFLEAQWAELGPDRPFAYTFLDEAYDRLYRSEARLGTLFGIFAGLAILVACLGLFGLATYAAERRTKEIGVRKVLGASVPDVVVLLSKEFGVLVLLAFVVAAPAAVIALDRWLAEFAYRTDWGAVQLGLAGGLTLLVALLTVAARAYRAALADPVESLRYE